MTSASNFEKTEKEEEVNCKLSSKMEIIKSGNQDSRNNKENQLNLKMTHIYTSKYYTHTHL